MKTPNCIAITECSSTITRRHRTRTPYCIAIAEQRKPIRSAVLQFHKLADLNKRLKRMCAASAGQDRSSHQRRPISPYKNGRSGTLGNTTDMTGDTARPVGSWSIGAVRSRLPDGGECDDPVSLSGNCTCSLWFELECEVLHNAGSPWLEEEESVPSFRRWNI